MEVPNLIVNLEVSVKVPDPTALPTLNTSVKLNDGDTVGIAHVNNVTGELDPYGKTIYYVCVDEDTGEITLSYEFKTRAAQQRPETKQDYGRHLKGWVFGKGETPRRCAQVEALMEELSATTNRIREALGYPTV